MSRLRDCHSPCFGLVGRAGSRRGVSLGPTRPLVWGAFITGFLGLHRGSGFLPTLTHPLLVAVHRPLCCAVLIPGDSSPPIHAANVSPSTDAFVQAYIALPDEVVETATGGTITASGDAVSQPLSLRPRAAIAALVCVLAFGLFIAGGATGFGARDARHLAVGLLVLGNDRGVRRDISTGHTALPGLLDMGTERGRRAVGAVRHPQSLRRLDGHGDFGRSGYFMALSSRAMRDVEGWRSRALWLSSPEATSLVLTGVALVLMGVSLVLTASRSGTVCLRCVNACGRLGSDGKRRA